MCYNCNSLEKIMSTSHGTLENEIMNAVWTIEESQSAQISVSDVVDYINKNGSTRAYTTVKTVMDRLTEKALLVRKKYGKKFCYASTSSRRESANVAIRRLAGQYFNNDVRMLMKALEKECLV